MRTAAPSSIPNRRARFITWAGLWLVWMQDLPAHLRGEEAPFAREMRAWLEARLDRMADLALKLVIIAADERLPACAPRRAGGPPRTVRGAMMRAAIGSLRKRVRSRDLRERAHRILALLRDPEAAIRKLMKRLCFTRRANRRFAAIDDARAPHVAAPVAHADTS